MQTHVTAFRSEALVTLHRLGSDMEVVDVLPTRAEIASRDAALTDVAVIVVTVGVAVEVVAAVAVDAVVAVAAARVWL